MSNPSKAENILLLKKIEKHLQNLVSIAALSVHREESGTSLDKIEMAFLQKLIKKGGM